MENIIRVKPNNVQFLSDDSRTPDNISYMRNLSLQENRINMLASMGNKEGFIDAVRIFDIMLVGKRDEAYRRQREELNKLIDEYRQKIMPFNNIDDAQEEQLLSYEAACKLYEILMLLKERKGMNGQNNVVDEVI